LPELISGGSAPKSKTIGVPRSGCVGRLYSALALALSVSWLAKRPSTAGISVRTGWQLPGSVRRWKVIDVQEDRPAPTPRGLTRRQLSDVCGIAFGSYECGLETANELQKTRAGRWCQISGRGVNGRWPILKIWSSKMPDFVRAFQVRTADHPSVYYEKILTRHLGVRLA
jgi:hypothetical protein